METSSISGLNSYLIHSFKVSSVLSNPKGGENEDIGKLYPCSSFILFISKSATLGREPKIKTLYCFFGLIQEDEGLNLIPDTFSFY